MLNIPVTSPGRIYYVYVQQLAKPMIIKTTHDVIVLVASVVHHNRDDGTEEDMQYAHTADEQRAPNGHLPMLDDLLQLARCCCCAVAVLWI